jgi:8-oxo-dGTP pyrophosphatase MutT (NUDIX family)
VTERPARGGTQRIPRPPGARQLGPAPWSDRDLGGLDLSLDAITRALDDAGPGRAHPIERTGIRASAVLAPLYELDGEVHVVFTRRAQHLRSHRGEVSFPGGGRDPGDADLVATALRESWEETALDPATVEVVGELDHLTTVTSRSFIVPYVGVLPGRPELVANPDEVEAILHVPLPELLDPEGFRAERWGLPGLNRPVYFFEVPGDTIWGATAAMLVNFLAIVTGTADRHVPGV